MAPKEKHLHLDALLKLAKPQSINPQKPALPLDRKLLGEQLLWSSVLVGQLVVACLNMLTCTLESESLGQMHGVPLHERFAHVFGMFVFGCKLALACTHPTNEPYATSLDILRKVMPISCVSSGCWSFRSDDPLRL